MSFFMTENLGPIIQVFSRDLTVVSEDLIDSCHYALIYSFITVAIVVRTVQDQPIFLVIASPLLVLAAFILRTYNKKLKVVKTELKAANDELFHAISDSIEGVKVLRTAQGTGWAIDILNEAFHNARIAIVAAENCNIWLMRRLVILSIASPFSLALMLTIASGPHFHSTRFLDADSLHSIEHQTVPHPSQEPSERLHSTKPFVSCFRAVVPQVARTFRLQPGLCRAHPPLH